MHQDYKKRNFLILHKITSHKPDIKVSIECNKSFTLKHYNSVCVTQCIPTVDLAREQKFTALNNIKFFRDLRNLNCVWRTPLISPIGGKALIRSSIYNRVMSQRMKRPNCEIPIFQYTWFANRGSWRSRGYFNLLILFSLLYFV